jgi:hypothetical protein
MNLSEILTLDEISSLSSLDRVQSFLQDAAGRASRASSLYDVGIARGLLLALYKDGVLDNSQFDRLFKAVYKTVPAAIIHQIPKDIQANLGKGVIVPASPSTRNSR